MFIYKIIKFLFNETEIEYTPQILILRLVLLPLTLRVINMRRNLGLKG